MSYRRRKAGLVTHINESDGMREIALSILGVEYRDNTLQLT